MDLLYELWLHNACDFDPKKVEKCIFIFQNAYNAFHSKPYSLARIRGFGLSGFLSAPKDLSGAERIIKDCAEKDIRIITIDDEDYPYLLKEMYLPPRILFVKGKLRNFDDYFPISAVGTRHATQQGKLFTEKLAEDLVRNNKVLIVSGMAEGIDACAHRGALNAGGKTVAVLAGGVDIIYPSSNRKLYYDILENGAVISEKPPGIRGKSYFYKQRNRIIAGLSKAVIAVEGSLKSGTKLTTNHAEQNNRDIFAVPSNPMAVQSQLPNQLIKDGAHIISKADDIIEEYIDVYPEYFYINKNNNKTEEKSFLPSDLSDEERKIIDYIMQKGGKAHAEDLAAALNMPIGKLNSSLMVLSIKGILSQQSQNEYLLKEVECFAN